MAGACGNCGREHVAAALHLSENRAGRDADEKGEKSSCL